MPNIVKREPLSSSGCVYGLLRPYYAIFRPFYRGEELRLSKRIFMDLRSALETALVLQSGTVAAVPTPKRASQAVKVRLAGNGILIGPQGNQVLIRLLSDVELQIEFLLRVY